MHVAHFAEELVDHHQIAACAAERIAVTPTPLSAASCEIGPMVARPTPRPSTTMFFHSGLERETDAERAHHVAVVAGREGRHAACVPRPTHL